jgi:hypothetical protein
MANQKKIAKNASEKAFEYMNDEARIATTPPPLAGGQIVVLVLDDKRNVTTVHHSNFEIIPSHPLCTHSYYLQLLWKQRQRQAAATR